MSEFIDPNASAAFENKPLFEGPCAKARAYAAGLPAWHPVRQLFTGPSQRLANDAAVYSFLRLFCEVYEEYIWPPSGRLEIDVDAEFRRLCPNDVLFAGRRYRLHRLHAKARSSIENAADVPPALRAVALKAFDASFRDLVRAIRSNFSSPR